MYTEMGVIWLAITGYIIFCLLGLLRRLDVKVVGGVTFVFWSILFGWMAYRYGEWLLIGIGLFVSVFAAAYIAGGFFFLYHVLDKKSGAKR